MTSSAKPHYRPELDGLRAVAVSLVVLYHAGINGMSGGFVGVDVFFVLSGYLIALVLVDERKRGPITIWTFYWRRGRRILPAFFAMLILSIVVSIPILTAYEINDFGRNLAANAVFLSDYYYGLRHDYFSPAGLQNPLLHTWSIAVEIKFYLIAPLLLLAVRRLELPKLALIASVFLISLVSFAFFSWLTIIDPQRAYFSFLGRFWEFGIGVIVALIFGYRGLSGVSAVLAVAGGLALILSGVVWAGSSPDTILYPVLMAVLGSALFISGGSGNVTARAMSLSPMLFIGKISFSLYLLHWPVFGFYRKYSLNYNLTLLEVLTLSAVSIVLAWLSWRFIERTGMYSRERQPLSAISVALVCAVSVFSAGLLLRSWSIHPSPQLAELSRYGSVYLNSERFHAQFEPLGAQCFLSDSESAASDSIDFEACQSQPGAEPDVFVIGDSHAAALTGPIVEFFENKNVVPIQAVGCRFIVPFTGTEKCQLTMQHTLESILPNAEPAAVVITARWSLYSERFGEDALNDNLQKTIRVLKANTPHRVFIVGPGAEFPEELPVLVARAKWLGRELSVIQPRQEVRALNEQLRTVSERSGAIYIDALAQSCAENICSWLHAGEPTHFDTNHLTDVGARKLVLAIDRALNAAE